MKRTTYIIVLITALTCLAPLASAQEHGSVGAFVSYLNLRDTSSNFVGVGGRVAINANRYIGLEAEMSYDFSQAFTETFNNSAGAVVTVHQSNLQILDGLFGPTLQTGHGPLRLFVTAKGGFVDFMFSSQPASFNSFTSSVSNLRANNVDGAFYPGGGIEGHIGPIGLRLDVGDEIYFTNTAHNNLRVTFGPTIRF